MATNTKSTPMQLGSKSISKLLVEYSVPAIIASVATSLYNIIDSIFIGRGVGAMAIAGLAITFPLMNLVAAFCMLIAVGGATISSIFLGQNNPRRATDTVNNVASLCLIHAVVFGGTTLLFLDEILTFFGATAETLPYAREFMEVILYGTPASYVLIGLNNVMRATGYPAKAMITALISVVVNIALCPLFIFTLDMGIRGAALATVIGQSVGAIWVIWHFVSPKSFIRLSLREKWFNPAIMKRIYAIGLSPFLMNVCACVVVVFINKALLDYGGSLGNMAIGAYGILNRASMFFVMIVFGVTQGMQPILGFNYGAQKWDRVKRTLNMGVWIGVAITSVGWFITEFFPCVVSGLFTVDPTLISMADHGARIFFIAYPFVGCQIVIQNFFQSVGMPKISIFLSLTRQLIFLLPFLFILPRHWGIDGVWASLSASDFIAFVLAIITLIIINRRENRRHAANQTSIQPND
ncbi:MAG: MATE family efflux transporter [Firmicutes bacterium]|nr:MATE family efflux transporter [Bacillota bacterium]MCM1401534.1 MATE family efflux transporter [Bacteroides sp.]MCM1476580.1 MATE family efflux transporter [Bacteroides sp.]